MRETGQSPADIPAYALYGEAGIVPDGIHAETIAVRSSRLDWRIGAHRHATLHQALLIRQGSAEASLEGRSHRLGPGTLAWIPALTVHAYDFEPQTVGAVVSVPAHGLLPSLPDFDDVARRLDGPLVVAAPPGGRLEMQVLAILAEFDGTAFARSEALSALAALLVIALARSNPVVDAAPEVGRGDRTIVRRFLALLEESYLQPRPLTSYAQSLDLSVSHLSRTCRRVTGRSPLRLIHDRRLIEAKRDLVYTDRPIQSVAERLGFDSPAYFSRFFKERTGIAPQAYRATSGRGEETSGTGMLMKSS